MKLNLLYIGCIYHLDDAASMNRATTASTIFARITVREYRIPFKISGNKSNAETVEAIRDVQRMKANSEVGKTYIDINQMLEKLIVSVEALKAGNEPKIIKGTAGSYFDNQE